MSRQTRKLLVLDLDETLIYARSSPTDYYDFTIDTGGSIYYVQKRPYLDVFLRYAAEYFDIAFWTAATRYYAEEILRRILHVSIEPKFLFTREETSFIYKRPVKDLYYVWSSWSHYDETNTLVLDDNSHTYRYNVANALRIRSFQGDVRDNELIHLLHVLEEISKSNDVRFLQY